MNEAPRISAAYAAAETGILVYAKKERIVTELNVAANIQTDMLPKVPPFPWRADDIFASMPSAKEAGGDFYDFFLIDDGHMRALVSDASGKGVPAALFAVIAKALIDENMKLKRSPELCFELVNNALFENNDSAMFVNSFMGVPEMSTGKFTYVNAGRNPPFM
ncbi:MAG: SpoIIE family protein phosphatase [Clostridiales bacterium]|nr:SpoIIE family protein phosphatase [Clostridiales bacterium]